MMNDIAQAGGLWFVLTIAHFIFDWVPQTHADATAKSKNWRIRGLHVTMYTTLMVFPFLCIFWHHQHNLPVFLSYFIISFGVTWMTHFIGDSYIIVFAWAKYIRKIPPELQTPKEPLTLILAIVIDQLWHILWLGVPVALAV